MGKTGRLTLGATRKTCTILTSGGGGNKPNPNRGCMDIIVRKGLARPRVPPQVYEPKYLATSRSGRYPPIRYAFPSKVHGVLGGITTTLPAPRDPREMPKRVGVMQGGSINTDSIRQISRFGCDAPTRHPKTLRVDTRRQWRRMRRRRRRRLQGAVAYENTG